MLTRGGGGVVVGGWLWGVCVCSGWLLLRSGPHMYSLYINTPIHSSSETLPNNPNPPNPTPCTLSSYPHPLPPPTDVLVSDTAPLGVVYQSADMMAGSTIPCMMLGLGATLITTRGGKALPLRVIGGVFTVRLILLPLLGMKRKSVWGGGGGGGIVCA